jgi:hypothetical protein
VGIFVALSANTPSPRKFAAAAVIALPIAALLAGVTEFLVLDGVDQAMRRSQASANDMPAPAAGPFTIAIVGFGISLR